MGVGGIARVGVIGAGTMGSRIAFQCILCGKIVYLFDISRKALDQAVEMNREWLSQTMDPKEAKAALARLHRCTSFEDCVKESELVIETVSKS